MTELQMGLIGLGALAVVGVLAYNKWQESRHRKIAERMMGGGQHADVLLDEPASHASVRADVGGSEAPQRATPAAGGAPEIITRVGGRRVEPVLRVDPQVQTAEQEDPGAGLDLPADEANVSSVRREVPVAAGRDASELTPEKRTPEKRTPEKRSNGNALGEVAFPFHLLSPLIDYVASFEAIQPASAQQILDSQRDILVRVRKPIHWLGYNEQRQDWEAIVDDGRSEYRRLCVGLQLVDRGGPLGEADLSVFHLAMQELAEELMAVVDLPTRDLVLETAAHLDHFSAGVDIQIGLNVVSQGQPFAGTKLRALAEAAGMAFDDEGHFVRRDDEGYALYRLVNEGEGGFAADSIKSLSTHGVTFLLDVPRVANGDRVFNQMLDLARRFADALHGALVDDNRRPLSEGALEPIRHQIGEYQAAMASRNLPAGGHLALRLFS